MSDEDKETKSAGQDFRERGTVGTAMEYICCLLNTKYCVPELTAFSTTSLEEVHMV